VSNPGSPRSIIVCGGRDYKDAMCVSRVLDSIAPDTIIEGGARGADELARKWASGRDTQVLEIEANWKVHGKAAGPIRNREMLDRLLPMPGPIAVVAFPGGRGTANMVRQAKAKGVTVIDVPAIMRDKFLRPPRA